MKKVSKAILSLILTLALLLGCVVTAFAASKKDTLEVGVGRGDITGPITSISTGYNSVTDLMEGLLTRLNARAFVVKKGSTQMAYCSAELVHMTESIKPGVLEELHKRGLNQYNEANTMLSATHCHASTSNVSWYGLYDLVNGVPGYDEDSYKYIVKGIADAIENATKDLAPGKAKLAYAKTDIHSYNRSLDAAKWDVNYDAKKFKNDLDAVANTPDKEMSVISFAHDKEGPIGCIAFFPSHGTSNGIDNRLVAADHKGYAAYKVEQEMGNGYICALPQNESGDVSPNKPQDKDYHLAFERPADIDKSLDPIENQIVPGTEEANWIMKILKGGPGVTTINLSPKLAYNYTTVDFSNIKVDKKYIGPYHMPYDDVDHAQTSEPCIGAAIIAGDEEGAPVDNAKEGAVRRDYSIDPKTGKVSVKEVNFAETIELYGLQYLFDPLWPTAMKILQSDGYDDAQMEKVVCLAVGKLMQKTQPVQLFQIGELAIGGCSFELNTEQGRRIRECLTKTLAPAGIKKVIMSTHTNAYSQYVTTREEYAAQHYEGSTCLFGPWSGSALEQELDKLAQDLVKGKQSPAGPSLAKEKTKLAIPTYASVDKPKADTNDPGQLVTDVAKGTYKNGEKVEATFTAANPRNICLLSLDGRTDLVPKDYSYLYVQKKEGNKWVTVRVDEDPYTYIHYTGHAYLGNGYNATVGWLLRNVDPGTYRLVYNGVAKDSSTQYHAFSVASAPFNVVK